MDMQWIKKLSQNTADITERLYVRVLEDVEVLRGPLEDEVGTCLARLPQLGVTIGQFVAKTARTGTRGIVARRVRGRRAWVWRHSTQLQS